MADTYTYAALSQDSAGIRLLTVWPGAWDDEVRCDLQHTSLDDKPSYEALSYTWGDANDTRQISLGGYPWSVTANLEVAIRYLRQEDRPRVIWIDALCINQADLEERARQVPRMQQIYKLADAVIAWLGPPGDDGHTAMASIEKWAKCLADSDVDVMAMTPEYFQQQGFDLSAMSWAAIWSLLERPYWERVWVIQELAICAENSHPPDGGLAISSDPGRIVCGSKTLPSWMFQIVCFTLCIIGRSEAFLDGPQALEPWLSIATKGTPPAVKMFLTALSHDDGSRLHPSGLLQITSMFKATDPRDKIYALINLLRNEDAVGIKVDYTKPLELVLTDLVKHLVKTDGDLSSLPRNCHKLTSLTPSWAPDVIEPVLTSGAAWVNGPDLYRAAGNIPIDVDFTEDPPALIAKGVLIGEMELVFGPCIHHLLPGVETLSPDSFKEAMPEWDRANQRLREFVQKAPPVDHERLWRTLVMDLDMTDFDNVLQPAPPAMALGFRVVFAIEELPADFLPELPEEARKVKYTKESGFPRNYMECLQSRSFFTTKGGDMGLGPFLSQPGDVVAALFGAKTFMALRSRDEAQGGAFEYLGNVYVQGGMNGEFVQDYIAGNTARAEYFKIY